MAESAEFDKLKALLESSAGTEDKDAMLQNILNYIQNAKDESGLGEEELVHKLLADLRSMYKPQATYHEYLLFVGVVSLVISIFGERRQKKLMRGILNNLLKKKIYHGTNKLFCSSFRLLSTAFFGYKLYRSLTERQRKREEKLRAKSAKKKK